MRDTLGLLVVGALVLGVGFGAIWMGQLAPAGIYVAGETPAGQGAYMAMRALGLIALVLIWMQLMVGVLMPSLAGRVDRGTIAAFHRHSGLLALVAVLAHPGFFLWAVAQRGGGLAIDFLLPVPGRGFYLDSVAIGAAALYLVLLGSAAAALRRRPAIARIWRHLHRANGVVYLLATIHCLRIGSETRLLAAGLLIALAGAGVLVALGARLGPGRSGALQPPAEPVS